MNRRACFSFVLLLAALLQTGCLFQFDSSPFDQSSARRDRKSTRLNSSHRCTSYAVFCLKKKMARARKPAQPDQGKPDEAAVETDAAEAKQAEGEEQATEKAEASEPKRPRSRLRKKADE